MFARAGCNLILTARRIPELESVASLAKIANQEGNTGKGGKIQIISLDMQDRDEVSKLYGKFEEGTQVDILVNNAGKSICFRPVF